MPWCGLVTWSSGVVRVSRRIRSASRVFDVHTLRPLITYVSPSRTARCAPAAVLLEDRNPDPPTCRHRLIKLDWKAVVTIGVSPVGVVERSAGAPHCLSDERDVGAVGSHDLLTVTVGAFFELALRRRWLVTAMVQRVGFVRTISVSFWTWAVTMVGLSFTTSPDVAIGLFLALGIGNGLWTALANTIRQQLTPNRLLGRMNAAYRTVAWGVVPFGAAFGGLSAQLFGIRAPFIVAGAAHVLIACLAVRLLRPVRNAGFT